MDGSSETSWEIDPIAMLAVEHYFEDLFHLLALLHAWAKIGQVLGSPVVCER